MYVNDRNDPNDYGQDSSCIGSPLIINAVRIPQDAERVIDADEEVFILYSELQAKPLIKPDMNRPFRGLGYLDSHQDILSISIELEGGQVPNTESGLQSQKKNVKRRARTRQIADKTIEIEIAQDTTALRSRKGDTGSVIWYASVDFARSILQQAHIPTPKSLFDFGQLKEKHILELGAGTGILSLLFSPLCEQYTATDIPELIPLIQKNIDMNFSSLYSPKIRTIALDWVQLKNTPQHRRHNTFLIDRVVDLLLVVDCIYHPSLLPSLVETMDYFASPNRTVVLVVSELRSDQVIREFLKLWLALPGWIIDRIAGLVSGPYVAWAGQKITT